MTNPALRNMCRHTFRHAGLTLSYLDNHQKSDQPVIILLHGFTASAQSNWLDSGWIALLSQSQRRVIALDARGHGYSDKPYDSNYYPSNVMAHDCMALLEQLNLPNADVIGYSMGARMAAFAAIYYPDRVNRLLLGGMGINLKHGVGNPQPIADALLTDDMSTIKDRYARRFRRLADRSGNDLSALAYCILSSRQGLSADDLACIQAKTLTLVGDKDDIGGDPHELAPYIQQCDSMIVADCNHFNALTQPAFRQAGIDFILS